MPALRIKDIINCLSRIGVALKANTAKASYELRKIGKMIDAQIPYHDGHALKVCDLALRIGAALKLTKAQMLILEATALLHDFGKIGLRTGLLIKTTPLTRLEKKQIQSHVLKGYYMLQGFKELNEILKGVRDHHEHYDGGGYPLGLTGNHICLNGRIIAIADAFAAMTSDRPYRQAKTKKEALGELKKCSGKQFDPHLVRKLMEILDKDHDT